MYYMPHKEIRESWPKVLRVSYLTGIFLDTNVIHNYNIIGFKVLNKRVSQHSGYQICSLGNLKILVRHIRTLACQVFFLLCYIMPNLFKYIENEFLNKSASIIRFV